jgi:DNA repair protein RecN (Recombination protein N)
MLEILQIRNYALIEALDVTWAEGLTAMTGETGSGKSIVLGALGLVLGGRSDAQQVREGEAKCSVEAVFQGLHTAVRTWLREMNFDDLSMTGGKLRIRREILAGGRSRAFIQDSPAKVGDLAALAPFLVDLHGQDETRALMERETRLALLDAAGSHTATTREYQDRFADWQAARKELAAIEKRLGGPQADGDYLDFQIRELDALKLDQLDSAALEAERDLLENASAIRFSLLAASDLLDGDSHADSANILDSLKRAEAYLGEAAEHLPVAREWSERMGSVRIELMDLASDIARSADGIEEDPGRLAQLNTQLDHLNRALVRHQAADVADLKQKYDALCAERLDAETLEEQRTESLERVEKLQVEVASLGEALTAGRQAAADALCQQVMADVQELKMPHAQLQFAFDPLPDSKWDEWGTAEVEILFSANPGSRLAPLAQVASGGERSRLMLALKAAKAASQPGSTIVLDEIDTGVSGEVASRMAALMARMAEHQQVLTVTHLPQVAARAHHHVEVKKITDGQSTRTLVEPLSDAQRIEAIATMLSGAEITQAARAHAEALLASAT